MVLTTGWLFLVRLKCPLRTIVHLLSGFIIYLGVVAPHYVLQNQGNDSRTPQLANRSAGLVKGLRAYDSRYENAPGDAWFVEEMDEFRQLGTLKWLWRHAKKLLRASPPI